MEAGQAMDPLRQKYVRNRWWKVVTLLNNPAIVLDIAQQEVREQMRKGEKVVSVPVWGYYSHSQLTLDVCISTGCL